MRLKRGLWICPMRSSASQRIITFCHPSQLDLQHVDQFTADYFKFTFVRNPYTRILSTYLDKIAPTATNSPRKKAVIGRFLSKPPGADITFSNFLDYLEFRNSVSANGHWARQSDFLVMPVSAFDAIGKVESPDDDLPHILREIFRSKKTIINWTPHATVANRSIHTLSTAQRRRIFRLYEADFDNFRYPVNQALITLEELVGVRCRQVVVFPVKLFECVAFSAVR